MVGNVIAPLGIVVVVVLTLAVGAAVVRYGEPLKRLDLERLYLHIVAAVFALWTVSSASGLLTFAAMMWTRTGQLDPRFLSERIATHLAYLLVGLPAWLWLYGRARRLTYERQAVTMHRAYLYLLALFGGLMAVIACGMLLGQGVRLAMGLVDPASPVAVRGFQASLFEWTINAVMYAVFWWAHFRAVRRWTV